MHPDCGRTLSALERRGNNSYHRVAYRGRDGQARGHLVGDRSARQAFPIVGLGPGAPGRSRSDHIQQIKADYQEGSRTLAVDGIGRQGDRRAQVTIPHLCRPDRAATEKAQTVPLLGFAEDGLRVFSTTAAFRPATAATRFRFLTPRRKAISRAKCPAGRWSRCITTATFLFYPGWRRSAPATVSCCACATANAS